MVAQHPYPAGLTLRLDVLGLLFEVVFLDLGRLDRSIESEGLHIQICDLQELGIQYVGIPLGELRRLVVGQPEGLDLLFGQVVADDDRNLLQLQLESRQPSGVPGDDHAV